MISPPKMGNRVMGRRYPLTIGAPKATDVADAIKNSDSADKQRVFDLIYKEAQAEATAPAWNTASPFFGLIVGAAAGVGIPLVYSRYRRRRAPSNATLWLTGIVGGITGGLVGTWAASPEAIDKEAVRENLAEASARVGYLEGIQAAAGKPQQQQKILEAAPDNASRAELAKRLEQAATPAGAEDLEAEITGAKVEEAVLFMMTDPPLRELMSKASEEPEIYRPILAMHIDQERKGRGTMPNVLRAGVGGILGFGASMLLSRYAFGLPWPWEAENRSQRFGTLGLLGLGTALGAYLGFNSRQWLFTDPWNASLIGAIAGYASYDVLFGRYLSPKKRELTNTDRLARAASIGAFIGGGGLVGYLAQQTFFPEQKNLMEMPVQDLVTEYNQYQKNWFQRNLGPISADKIVLGGIVLGSILGMFYVASAVPRREKLGAIENSLQSVVDEIRRLKRRREHKLNPRDYEDQVEVAAIKALCPAMYKYLKIRDLVKEPDEEGPIRPVNEKEAIRILKVKFNDAVRRVEREPVPEAEEIQADIEKAQGELERLEQRYDEQVRGFQKLYPGESLPGEVGARRGRRKKKKKQSPAKSPSAAPKQDRKERDVEIDRGRMRTEREVFEDEIRRLTVQIESKEDEIEKLESDLENFTLTKSDYQLINHAWQTSVTERLRGNRCDDAIDILAPKYKKKKKSKIFRAIEDDDDDD